MAKISDFLPYVLPYAMGCAEPTAITHINNTCVDFCIRTGVWKETLDEIDLSQGEPTYYLDAPLNADISSVYAVYIDGIQISLRNDSNADIDLVLRSQDAPSIPISALYSHSEKAITLFPAPDVSRAKKLKVRAVLRPKRSSTYVPDVLFSEYVSVIASGALGSILSIPSQTFTDPSFVYHKAKYESAIAPARNHVDKNFSYSNLRVRARPFA